MIRLLVALLIGVLAAGPPNASAQDVQRIAAIVNDDVISLFDLDARVRLVIVSTRLRDTPRVRRRIAPQVLRTLIDERLQLQEAKRRNVSVSKREMKRAVGRIEKMNDVRPGGLRSYLAANGVELESVTSQIRANIAWQKLIQRRFLPRIRVGEDEIDEALKRIEKSRGETEFRLSEIFLSVDSLEEDADVRRAAQRLAEQVRGGARFSALARQLSKSATAAVGGDLGWIGESALPDHLKELVPKLRVNQVSEPLRTLSGYQIVQLRNRRKTAGADPSKIKVTLRQLFLPASGGLAEQRRKAESVRQTLSGCDGLAAAADRIESSRAVTLGTFQLTDLSPTIREAVTGLEIGKPSPPVPAPGGLMLLMVCKRDAPKVSLPKRDDVRKQLMTRRIDLISRRLLRDVRLAAVIEIRV